MNAGPALTQGDLAFLSGGGEMGALIRSHDWARTSLGPPALWPQPLRTAVRLMLNTRHPIYIFWGPAGACLYNDAFRLSIGPERHPSSLGRPAREVWAEIWDVIGGQIEQVMVGRGATWHENALVPITRNGRREDVYWTYSYGPIDDETAESGVGGVLVVCTETTATVLAERQRALEAERQQRMFEQAPALIAILHGPDHVYAFVNNAHRRLFGSAGWIGRPVRDAFTAVAGQGIYEVLDQVYASGERHVAKAASIRFPSLSGGGPEEHLIDLIYEPITDDAGQVTGIFCQGFDVTEATRTEQVLRASEVRQGILLRLLQGQRETDDPDAMMQAAAEALRDYLGANRVSFFEMADDETLAFRVGCTDGVLPPLQGSWAAANIGTRYLAAVRAGRTLGLSDTETDPLTADSCFGEIGVRALIGAPIIRGGRWIAGLCVDHATTRGWGDDDVAFVRSVADLTWDAIERARAVTAMRESEQRFREIADAAPVLIWMSDTSRACTWVNRPWLDFTGCTLAQAQGQGWADLTHPADRARRDAVTSAAIERREPFRFDHRMRRYDGVWRIVDVSGVPRFGRDGAFLGYIGSGVDVTDQRSAEAALRESEEQLRLATEAAEVGLWDLDLVSDTLFWPPRVKAMFGISPDVPVSMTDFYAGLYPDDREHVAAAFARALDPARRAIYDVEFRTIGKEDGRIRWVAAKGRGVFDAAGNCARAIGTAVDITERKRVEERLRELNETLERRVDEALAERKILADIVESTDALIQVVDPDYRWMAINRASAKEFEHIFGIRPKAGDNLLDLLRHAPDQQATAKELWGRALAGESFTAVDMFGDPAPDHRHYEMKFNALRDRDDRIIGAYQFAYDVTDRLRDQARLAEAEEQLRQAQKIEAIGQLTGGVAHDFNNLLTVILGGLTILEMLHDPIRRQRIIGNMRKAAERGASLSRQLLAFSRRQPLHPEPVDLNRQINGMRDLLDRTLDTSVRVETRFPPDLWAVQVDPGELELVVLNLCGNSRDAMPEGGTITISAENVPDLRKGDLHGDFVRLTVADTGVGMSKDVLARVFEPFFTTKEIGKGSGLGLPQVYGFARQSGGTVEMVSSPGQGTEVTLLLPRSPVAPSAPARHIVDLGANRPSDGAAGSVLLVEDDDEVAALVTEMLGQLGYGVTRAASAEGALGALANGRAVDVVFSDVMMPGSMNGIVLAREIRRRRPDLPILLTSGRAEAARRDANADRIEVLAKPYGIDALAAALRRAMGHESPPLAREEEGASQPLG